jgi:hypothetical protein
MLFESGGAMMTPAFPVFSAMLMKAKMIQSNVKQSVVKR